MPFFHYDSRNFHYMDEGQGEVLVLLPGNTASSVSFLGEIRFFSRDYRVICPDYIGCGKSQRAGEFPVDFWQYHARMMVTLLHEMNIGPYRVVGTSGGGLIALNMAILDPGGVSMVIADSIPGEFFDDRLVAQVIQSRNPATLFQRTFWEKAHGEDWKEVVEADSRLVRRVGKENKSVFGGRLEEIACPILLTASLADDVVPDIHERVSRVARKISTSKLILYPRGGHPMLWSRARDFRRDVLDFIHANSSS